MQIIQLLGAFSRDETGAVYALEKILMTTVFGLGLIAGLAALRDGIVQEMGDTAVALENIEQSYTYTINGVTTTHTENAMTLTDPAGQAPAGLDLDSTANLDE